MVKKVYFKKLFKIIKILHREVGLPTISEFLKPILCLNLQFSWEREAQSYTEKKIACDFQTL